MHEDKLNKIDDNLLWYLWEGQNFLNQLFPFNLDKLDVGLNYLDFQLKFNTWKKVLRMVESKGQEKTKYSM